MNIIFIRPLEYGLKTLLMVFGIFYASEYFFNYNLAPGIWPTFIAILIAIYVVIDIIRVNLGYSAPTDFLPAYFPFNYLYPKRNYDK